MAYQEKKKDNSSKTVIIVVVLVFLGAALFALGVFLGMHFSGKQVLLEGMIQHNENTPFVYTELEMETVLTDDQKELEGEEAVAYFGFSLDADYQDNGGRVRWDGKHSAKMKVRVSATITHAELLKQIEYRVIMPIGVIEAAKVGYLDISEFYETNADGSYALDTAGNFINKTIFVPVDETTFVDAENPEDGKLYSFQFELNLGWGPKFQGMNPSRYYDETDEGGAIPNEEVEETLNDLRNVILNGEEEARYTVYLNALPKENIQL